MAVSVLQNHAYAESAVYFGPDLHLQWQYPHCGASLQTALSGLSLSSCTAPGFCQVCKQFRAELSMRRWECAG